MTALTEWWPLSPREEQILLMYADGHNAGTIAAELGISRNTIKGHSYRLRLKLEANTVAHAVALAYHHGFLRPAL